MFERKTYGTCTSTAVYQTTVLRALGIPARMILCIPLADGSDPAQVALVEQGLTHRRVRCEALMGVIASEGFSSHTFCEVFVGGRWRRLNYTTLGQNVLDWNYLGLMVKVHTFRDLSDARLGETWGTRYAKGERSASFPRGNPYRLMEVGDHFGRHATVANPPAAKEHVQITIGKAYWVDGKSTPEEVRKARSLWIDTRRGDGCFLVHGEEWFEEAGDYLQYKLFLHRATRDFLLQAPGREAVSCQLSRGFFTDQSQELREIAMIIPATEYQKMARGVAYTLKAANAGNGFGWRIRNGVTLMRE